MLVRTAVLRRWCRSAARIMLCSGMVHRARDVKQRMPSHSHQFGSCLGSGSIPNSLLQDVTNLVNVEQELTTAVLNQINSSGFTDAILQEVGNLIDAENNLVLVEGAVPGPNGGLISIRPTNKKKR